MRRGTDKPNGDTPGGASVSASGPHAAGPAARRLGRWGVLVALTLSVVALSVVNPALLVFVPLSLCLLALPPRRPGLLAVGLALAAVAFVGGPDDPLWYAERGWALLLGGWFVALGLLWPAGGFLPRAITAVLGSVATSALLLTLARGWIALDWAVGHRVRVGASEAGALWAAASGGEGWGSQLSAAVVRTADLQALLYPSLLALASLSALALAWWAQRRLAGGGTRPLAPFRDFRFRDELVWLLIAGGVLLALPLGDQASRAGANALVFMGALYALRGAAVLLAVVGAPGPGGVVFAALAVVFLYPLVMAAALVVGLTDTWLDLRSRRRTAEGSGT